MGFEAGLHGRQDYKGRLGDPYPEIHPYGEPDLLDAELRTEVVEVRDTEKTGRGIFAREAVRKGQEALVFDGTKSTQDHAWYSIGSGVNAVVVGREKRHSSGKHYGDFIWADPADNSPLRYLNHSCDPNLGRSHRDPFVFMALRNIEAGEPLTADYSLLETNPEWNMPCLCGSARCRGSIGSIENVAPEYLAQYWHTIPDVMRQFALERSTDQRIKFLVQEQGVSKAVQNFLNIFPPKEYDYPTAQAA